MKADAKNINRLLKTAKGQLDGILKMVEQDKYCMEISHQIMACEAVLNRANREILKAHMESCVREAFEQGSEEETSKKIDELIDAMNKMSK